MSNAWAKWEVEATVADYFEMLKAELAGVPYSKSAHRRRLVSLLDNRSEQAIEFKHGNISAVLIDLGFPYIAGYRPRSNYQQLLYVFVADRLASNWQLLDLAAADAELTIVVPKVDDILSTLSEPPPATTRRVRAPSLIPSSRQNTSVNYLEREARNASLGRAGELFVLDFERARLGNLGHDRLAAKIEHTSRVRGDGEGFDILSFESSGKERLIEVKTTKHGRETPFFVSRREVSVSESRTDQYFLYRLFNFRAEPRLFTLNGAFSSICNLSPTSYVASVK